METLHPSLFNAQRMIAASLDDLIQMDDLAFKSFMKHKRASLQEVENLAKKVRHFEKAFAQVMAKEGNKQGVQVLLSLTPHLSRAADALEGVGKAVERKIDENTLFSDKAVGESTWVFTTVRDMVRDARDAVITGNPVLKAHVTATFGALSQAAQDFATAHEERLIHGVCQPKHSSIFLDVVRNLRNVGWHLRELVAQL